MQWVGTPLKIHYFSIKTHHSSSFSSMTKIKTLITSPAMCRAFSRAKSLLLKLAKRVHFIHLVDLALALKKKESTNQKKLFFGSFRLHYNWCSSHVMPLGQETYDSCSHNHPPASFSCYPQQVQESDDELSRYLQWLEEKDDSNNDDDGDDGNQKYWSIDKLAELFIENCHEKFRLEKQESYRRFQEMLARSV